MKINLFLLSSTLLLFYSSTLSRPSPVFADTLIENCVRKECDTVNFTPGHLVCIEIWQREDGTRYEKPGYDTQEPCSVPRVCTPGAVRHECDNTVPRGWCTDPDLPETYGVGKKLTCAADGLSESVEENCFQACSRPEPQVTPSFYSFEKSVGETNELLEGKILSGTRDVPIDDSDINNYGPLSTLMPAGIADELRVKFVKDYGNYEVTLGTGMADRKMKAVDIWKKCTQNGNLDNWRDYLDKLDNCQEWGFVPNKYRQITSTPLAVQTTEAYFKEGESPFVQNWTVLGIDVGRVARFFQDILCTGLGLFCPPSTSLPLRNSDSLTDWTKGKPNIPLEAKENSQLLRQFLLPEGIVPGSAPKENQSFFKTSSVLVETGQAAQQAAVPGGLFWIFQPANIGLRDTTCPLKSGFNPSGGCASEFHFELKNASPGICKTCFSDTPDQKAGDNIRPDDRPLLLQRGVQTFEQNLWPEGL